MGRIILFIIFQISLTSVLNSQDIIFPGKTWSESIPELQGVNSKNLSKALNYLSEKLDSTGGISSLVILRNGYIIYKGDSAESKHCIWSCSKSFTSTVLGCLIDEGKCTLETKAKDHVRSLTEHYPEVTLRHFATMTSGYDAKGGRYKDDPDDGSRTPLDPALPAFPPGTKYSYFDDAMRMNGYVLTMIAGNNLENYFMEKVGIPIGINPNNFSWEKYLENDRNTTFNNPDNADVRDAAGGVYVTPLDFARFGYLFLNKGKWNGNQIISTEWVCEATNMQVPLYMSGRDDTPRQRSLNYRGIGRYGYNWHSNKIGKDGVKTFSNVAENLFFASGYNNNKCFVIPDWKMVIIRMGTKGWPTHDYDVWSEFFRIMDEAIIYKD